MSLLRLPDELILPILRYACLQYGVRDHGVEDPVLALVLVSRRLRRLALPILYEKPEVFGPRQILKFLRILRTESEIASMVKILFVDFVQSGDEYTRWSSDLYPELQLPLLPQCTSLIVNPTSVWDGHHDEPGRWSLFLSLSETFQWTAMCPIIRHLEVRDLYLSIYSDRGLTIPPSLAEINVILPITLTELTLWGHYLYDEQMPAIWRLCTPWLKSLKFVQSSEEEPWSLQYYNMGIHVLRDCLQELSFCIASSNFYADNDEDDFAELHSLIIDVLPFLSTLRCPLPASENCTFTSTCPTLHTLEVNLPYHGDGAIQSLSTAIQGSVFPLLRKLTLWTTQSITTRKSAWLAIRKHKLGDSCADRSIKLDYRVSRTASFIEEP